MKPSTLLYNIRKSYGQDSIRCCIVKYLVSFLLSLACFKTHSQTIENNFEKVNIEIDGEEVYTVGEIVQDKQGYIWLATNLGLIRYDGLQGKLYDGEKSEASGDYIESLYVDHQGLVWIGADSGLSNYNPNCDCLNNYPSKIGNYILSEIRSIKQDKANNIWIGTKHGSLFSYEKENDRFTRILHGNSESLTIPFSGIYHLLIDQFNNIWIGTDSGLIRYNITKGNIKQFIHDPSDSNSILDNRISAIYEDQKGQILIGTFKSGFHIYDQKTELLNRINFDASNPNHLHAPYSTEKVFGSDPNVNLIHQDQNGGYWIGTTGKGINYFNSRTESLLHYDFKLVNPEVLWSLMEDQQGNLWIGGIMGAGLFKTDLFKFKYKVYSNFPNVGRVYESPLDPGILWICSQQYGLRKMNLNTNKVVSYLHDKNNIRSIGHTWVRSLYQENKNTLWAGLGNGGAYGGFDGKGGISRMNIESGRFTNFKLLRDDDGLNDFSYTVYSIVEDYEGYLWLGAGPGGIFRSDKEKKEFKPFKNFKIDDPSDDVFLNISRVDSNGDVWASDFAGEGTLYLYDREENAFNPYLEGFKMYNILIDEKGWLLISTWEKGLIHLNPADKTYIQYTKKEGLPSNEGLDIVKGEDGIYWVNTRFGPAKFNAVTGKIVPFDVPNYRYNTGVFKASNGHIYFGSNSGLLSFNTSQVTGNPFPPQINISELMIANINFLAKNIDSTDLTLSHDQNDITINYVGLHYSNPDKNLYRYRLEPLDENWVNAGGQRSVRFADLSPGTYDFQVTGSNSDGVWSKEIASVHFTINPPWWATWWAYLIYISALAFATYRIYHFQLSKKMAISESLRLKEVNQFKNNLFTNITHEFRTPLTVIRGMTESIRSNSKSKPDNDLKTSLNMIERNSEGLLHLVNEMLDLAKLESGNMELQLVQSDVIPFLKYLSESFSSLAEENKINLTIYSEIESLVMDFDSSKLTSIVSNLLSNAIKFTPELGKIIVHINQVSQKEKDYLFIKVKDNGIGIAKEELQNIFSRFYQTEASTIRQNEGTGIGLALTKELVELMNGTIEAKSSLDMGSEFTVLLPITRKAPITKQVKMGKFTQPLVNKPLQKSEQSIERNSELPLVLIIEDNLDVAHYLKTCLKNRYETIHAINGLDGIELALERIPDIIISDVMMPEIDGFEVCETLKSDERTDHIPIIILTAKASVEARIKGISHGADAYLAKPFNKEELFTRLDQLVSIRKKLINKIQSKGSGVILSKRTKDPKLKFLKKVIKLIHYNISNSDFGSIDLAKNLLVSESQIYRKIKAITGKSTAVFIRSIRLQFAKELLMSSDKTVSEVAYEVGFNDPSWFSRAFKEEFGYAPSAATK